MSKKIFEDYTESYNFKLLNRAPIVVHLNGRSFKKTTMFLTKPFCKELSDCFSSTLYKLCSEVEGCVFGYTFNDEIILILRNDQTKETLPWYDNRIQKINSVITSIATYNFTTAIHAADLIINGQCVFINQLFNLPKINDCMTYLTMCQAKNFINSLNHACEYELSKLNLEKDAIKTMLSDLSINDRQKLLYRTCNVDFMDYAPEFRRGVACYREHDEKAKWILDQDLIIFSEDQHWLLDKLNFIYY